MVKTSTTTVAIEQECGNRVVIAEVTTTYMDNRVKLSHDQLKCRAMCWNKFLCSDVIRARMDDALLLPGDDIDRELYFRVMVKAEMIKASVQLAEKSADVSKLYAEPLNQIATSRLLWLFRRYVKRPPVDGKEIDAKASGLRDILQKGPMMVSDTNLLRVCKSRPWTSQNKFHHLIRAFNVSGRAWPDAEASDVNFTWDDDDLVKQEFVSLTNPMLTGRVKLSEMEAARRKADEGGDHTSPVQDSNLLVFQIVWSLWMVAVSWRKLVLESAAWDARQAISRKNQSQRDRWTLKAVRAQKCPHSKGQKLLRQAAIYLMRVILLSRVSRGCELEKITLFSLTRSITGVGHDVPLAVQAFVPSLVRPLYYMEDAYKAKRVRKYIKLIHQVFPAFMSLLCVADALKLYITLEMNIDPERRSPLINELQCLFVFRGKGEGYPIKPMTSSTMTEWLKEHRPTGGGDLGYDIETAAGTYVVRHNVAHEIHSMGMMEASTPDIAGAFRRWFGHGKDSDQINKYARDNGMRITIKVGGVESTLTLVSDCKDDASTYATRRAAKHKVMARSKFVDSKECHAEEVAVFRD